MSRWLKLLVGLLFLAGAVGMAVALVFSLPTFGGDFEGARLERMRQSPEFIEGRFDNTPPYKNELALIRNIQDYLGGQIRAPQFEIPVIPLEPGSLLLQPRPGIRAVWFGHSSVLVEIDGVRIMTDPVLSQRASPFQFPGPERFHPPPVALDHLSGIDAVVISHDHYDHLDMDTVQQLARSGTHFKIPHGSSRASDHNPPRQDGVPRRLVCDAQSPTVC